MLFIPFSCINRILLWLCMPKFIRYIKSMVGIIWHAADVTQLLRNNRPREVQGSRQIRSQLISVNHMGFKFLFQSISAFLNVLPYCYIIVKKHKYVIYFLIFLIFRYKVIVRVIDDTGSASLVLFDKMVHNLVDVSCVELMNKASDLDIDGFPKQLNRMIGKKMLFKFLFSEYNINRNSHVYQVKSMSADPDLIGFFKKDFLNEVRFLYIFLI